MPVGKVDFDVERGRILAALRRARATGPNAREDAARVLVGEFARLVFQVAPKDTNRYVRGWVLAAHDVGARTFQPPPLQRSEWAGNRLEWLTEQLDKEEKNLRYWESIDNRYKRQSATPGVIKRGPRKGEQRAKRTREPYYINTVVPQVRRAKARVKRARTELEKFQSNSEGTAIVIFRNQSKNPRTRQVRFTVRDKVYGGRGQWLVAGNRTFAELTNLEPHSRIVEKQHGRPMSTALSVVRSFGTRRASLAYLRRVEEEAKINARTN